MPVTSINKEKHEDYKGFVEKFKPKKTTDDCYTPDGVYKIIKDWAVKEYGIDEDKIVRPFYPGGDFEKFDYKGGKVVIDNPPFSILKKIKEFYSKNNIKFFLFAPSLALFSSSDHESICYIVANATIAYHNKAKVNTSFVTNLDNKRIRLVPELAPKIKQYQDTNKKKRPKYKYPDNLIYSAQLGKLVNLGVSMDFNHNEISFTGRLDSQKEKKKTIFGGGYLISDEKAKELKAKELEAKELEAKEEVIEWELSDREKNIINNLIVR